MWFDVVIKASESVLSDSPPPMGGDFTWQFSYNNYCWGGDFTWVQWGTKMTVKIIYHIYSNISIVIYL